MWGARLGLGVLLIVKESMQGSPFRRNAIICGTLCLLFLWCCLRADFYFGNFLFSPGEPYCKYCINLNIVNTVRVAPVCVLLPEHTWLWRDLSSGITSPDVKSRCVNGWLRAREYFLEGVDDPWPVVPPIPSHIVYTGKQSICLWTQRRLPLTSLQ